MTETTKLKIMVLGTNANGEPDIFDCSLEVSKGQRENGEHHEKAMSLARAAGYEPKMAVDEDDGLWARLNPTKVYKRFAQEIVTDYQNTFMPGQECGGADLVERLANKITNFLTDELPAAGEPNALVIAYSDDGYIDALSGQCIDTSSAPSFTVIEDEIATLRAIPGAVIVELSLAEILQGAGELPTAQCLSATAETAHARAEEFGFAITGENAAEVMHEEMELFGEACPPPAFEPILVRAALIHGEKDRQAPRPLEAPRS